MCRKGWKGRWHQEEKSSSDYSQKVRIGPTDYFQSHCVALGTLLTLPVLLSCPQTQVVPLGFWVQKASLLLGEREAPRWGFLLTEWDVGHACKQRLSPGTNTGVRGEKKKRENSTCLILSSSDLMVFLQNILLSS